MFVYHMRWNDDLLLEHSSTRRGNLQLAMYAMHLATGNTLLCKSIKSGTIKDYVFAAASFLSLFGKEVDHRRSTPTDKAFCPELQAVYREIERWEKVPNRREPFTLEMLTDIQSQATTEPNKARLLPALADWFEAGLFSGLRLSEWAQDAGNHDVDSPKQSPIQRAQAFTLKDICFGSPNGRRIPASDLVNVVDDTQLTRVWVTHSWQKNADNGEERLFVKNPAVTGRCAVRAWTRIVRRFLLLRGPLDMSTPLALYMPSDRSSQPRLITSTEIESAMRHTACRVYQFYPVKHNTELKRWSAHSLRVGACAILHSMGFSATLIKWLLRWRSDAFMTYLRNLAINARQQVLAMDRASAMPNFL